MSVIFHVIKFFNHEESIRRLERQHLPQCSCVCLCLSLILNLLEQWHSVPVIEMASYIVVICVYNTLHSSHYTSEHFAEIRREREKNARRGNTRKRFSTAQKLSFKLSSTANFFYHSFWPFYLSFLFFSSSLYSKQYFRCAVVNLFLLDSVALIHTPFHFHTFNAIERQRENAIQHTEWKKRM